MINKSITGGVLLLFLIRYPLCWIWAPEMKIVGDWDSSNSLTMNIYAVMLLLSFVRSKLGPPDKIELLIMNVTIGLSTSDVIDRIIFQIYTYEHSDYFLIPITIIICIYQYVRGNGQKAV